MADKYRIVAYVELISDLEDPRPSLERDGDEKDVDWRKVDYEAHHVESESHHHYFDYESDARKILCELERKVIDASESKPIPITL